MDTIAFAFRSLIKSPVFSLVAILALALGIGANSAIFSMIEAIFLRPLPYAHSEQIVQLTSAMPERGINQGPFSWPRMLAVRERQEVFSDVSVSTQNAFIVTGSGDPEQLVGMIVSQNYFPMLGVQPILGRGFLPDEDRAGGAPVVLLTYGYWQKHFAGKADVIGQALTLDGNPRSLGVIGLQATAVPVGGVEVKAAPPAVVQNADTTEFSAKAVRAELHCLLIALIFGLKGLADSPAGRLAWTGLRTRLFS